MTPMRNKGARLEKSMKHAKNGNLKHIKTEDFLKDVVNSLDDPVFVKDREHRWIFLNDAACKFWGYEKKKLIGKSDYDLFPKEQADVYWEKDELVFKSGRTDLNEEAQTIDGKLYTISTKKSIYRDPDTGKNYIVGTIRDITGQKKAEEALRESEEKFRNLAERSPNMIFINKKGCVVYANKKGEEILGYKREEFYSPGFDFFTIIAPESRKLVKTNYNRHLRGEEVSPYEFTIVTRKEKKVDVLITTKLIDYEGDKALLGIVTDITEHKRAEKALVESEKRFRQIAELFPLPISILDSEGTYEFLNNEFIKVFGYTLKDIPTGRDWFQKAYPDLKYRKEVISRWKSDLEKARKYEVREQQFRVTCKDARVREIIFRPVTIEGEKQFIVYEDLTERMRAEETLRESEESFRTIVETAPSLLHITDSEGNNLYVSPNCKQITGYSQQELLGKVVWWVHEDDTERAQKAFARTYKTGTSYKNFEYKAKRKNGETWYASSSWETLRDKEGKIRGILLQTIDITERRKAEEEKEKIQNQLWQSHKIEAVGRLAGGIAHDFNNLLTAIIGYSDLLLRESIHKSTHAYIEEIKKSADRAAALTQQLLAFSRKQIMRPKIFCLNALIENIIQMLQRLISEDIELVTELDPELGNIRADPGQFEQIIVNLAVNARDAMLTGGTLMITTKNVYLDSEFCRGHRGSIPGKYIQLEVNDTGKGMDEEIKKHIFEPFFTTKEVGKGTGLGLATVYGIVKQSDGYIWVESELNRGTIVTIYLPRLDEQREEKKPTHEKTITEGGSEKILVVEDEDAVRSMVSKSLRDLGYTVIEARDGEKALTICETKGVRSIDLMITDVVMPKMSGRDLANQLLTKYPEMKVLYMSGYTDDVIVHHGVLYKGLPFLQKPFTTVTLSKKVREVLNTT